MSKGNGVAHRALDDLVKFKTAIVTDIGQFKTDLIKSFTDMAEKHNNMVAQIAALEGTIKNVAAFAASEMGRLGGTVEKQLGVIGGATNSIDLNVLALAELAKELVGQLTQIDFIFDKICNGAEPSSIANFSDEDIAKIKGDAEERYKEWVKSSFKTVQERQAREEAERQAAELRAKEVAEQAAAIEAEAKTVEDELQKAALSERTIATTSSGGPGSPFPDGADIFGG